jgi:small-conductance mechanosensitive channel
LDERKVRVRVPVGVAYGTDVAKVLEILKSCADSHPMVLNSPKPMALFKAFGASSLDFELRFWIPEFLDRSIATSELNQAIESEFALNNIEIPFPQTDLHIRSVSDTAAKAFGRGDEPPAAVNDMDTLQSNEVARVSPVEHEAESRPEPR